MKRYTGMLMATLLLLGSRQIHADERNAQAAREVLEKLGATLKVDDSLPGKPVVSVNLDYSDVHGETLKLLRAFPQLHSVRGRESWEPEVEDMKTIGGLTQLRNLDLWIYNAPDKKIKPISGLTKLESLTLYWVDLLHNEDLRNLQSLTNLRTLDLFFCHEITDDGLAHLQGLTNLRHLNL